MKHAIALEIQESKLYQHRPREKRYQTRQKIQKERTMKPVVRLVRQAYGLCRLNIYNTPRTGGKKTYGVILPSRCARSHSSSLRSCLRVTIWPESGNFMHGMRGTARPPSVSTQARQLKGVHLWVTSEQSVRRRAASRPMFHS